LLEQLRGSRLADGEIGATGFAAAIVAGRSGRGGGAATYSRTKYKNYTQVDIGVNYTFEKQHHFSAALNNVFDKGLEYGADGSNLYREFFDGRNVWLGYTYTF
jgi:outer membrane receptor for ferrienterochelin and colicins